MRAFTKEWLKASQDDLWTIEEIIDNPHLTHIVAFHAQQSVGIRGALSKVLGI